MVCLDENFEPVTEHDPAHVTMELYSMVDDVLTWRCALCGTLIQQLELTEVCNG